MVPFVSLEELEKNYRGRGREGGLKALDRISFVLAQGEFLSVVGPSGCGKSTLMMLVSGLIPASSGCVIVSGQTVRSPLTDVGIVFQRDALLEWPRTGN